MIQKEQKIYNVDLADEFFLLYPKALNITSNKNLYSFCNASTDVHKQNLRRRKKQIKEKKIVSLPEAIQNMVDQKPMDLTKAIVVYPDGTSKKLSEVMKDEIPGEKKLSEIYIENLIRDGLDDYPGNVQLIGKAVDFFVKVKTDKKEGTKQLLDMDGFLKLADTHREE